MSAGSAGSMNTDRATLLAQLRSSDGWIADIRRLAAVLRTPRPSSAGLLVVGTPSEEPWHLVAHLEQESRLSAQPALSPVLVRHRVTAGAAAHLAVDLSRLNEARPGEVVFVVAPTAAPAELLSRVQDARRAGAIILALEAGGDADLQGLADDSVTIDHQPNHPAVFDAAQHLLSVAAGQAPHRARRLVLKK